jgi:hypothetical protein
MPEIKEYPGTIIQLVAEMQKLVKQKKISITAVPDCLHDILAEYTAQQKLVLDYDKQDVAVFSQKQLADFWQWLLQKGLDFVVHFKSK